MPFRTITRRNTSMSHISSIKIRGLLNFLQDKSDEGGVQLAGAQA